MLLHKSHKVIARLVEDGDHLVAHVSFSQVENSVAGALAPALESESIKSIPNPKSLFQ